MTKSKVAKSSQVGLRVSHELSDRLKRCVIHAIRADPSTSQTEILTRGIELACEEIERRFGMIPEDINVIRLRAGRRVARRDE